MSATPIPPPLDQVGPRPFSFYPAIVNFEHNDWLYRKANWSEVLVMNRKSEVEVWIPRHYFGEASYVESPVVIVGLRKELEYRDGVVRPHVRRVIEMPRAVNDSAPPRVMERRPAPVVGIRLEPRAEHKFGRLAGTLVIAGVLGCVLLVSLTRSGVYGEHLFHRPALLNDPGLTAEDDYRSVQQRLGAPAAEGWYEARDGVQFRALHYPALGFSVILMGRGHALYAGSLDAQWRPLHTIPLAGGVDSSTVLRTLPRF